MSSKLIDKTPKEQTAHLKMLCEARDVLNKYGVEYVLSNAGLLGALRDGELIPWARGLVLIVKSEQIGALQLTLKSEFEKRGYHIRVFMKPENRFKITIEKLGLDLCVEITAYYLNRTTNRRERRVGNKYKSIPAQYYDAPYHKIKLRDEIFNVPFLECEYTELLYGKDWHTPIRSVMGKKFRNQSLYRFKNGTVNNETMGRNNKKA